MPIERARRRWHHKSRQGCGACKKKHIRCDEAKPCCKNCLIYGRICIFPDEAAEKAPTHLLGEISCDQAQAVDVPTSTPSFSPPVILDDHGPSRQGLLSPLCETLDSGVGFTGTEWALIKSYHETVPVMPIMQICRDGVIRDVVQLYFHLACTTEINKHSLLSLAATFHHRQTSSPLFHKTALQYRQSALRTLQAGIQDFSAENADIVLAASMNLSNQAANWSEWMCFTTGISKILQSLKSWNKPTNFKSHITNPFALRPTLSHTTFALPLALLSQTNTHNTAQIPRILSSLHTLSSTMPQNIYLSVGFSHLETVCKVTQRAFFVTDEGARFRQTDLLRMWMYYFPSVDNSIDDNHGYSSSREMGGNVLEAENIDFSHIAKLLKVHFYALVLASVSLFPVELQMLITQVSTEKIWTCWIEGVEIETLEQLLQREMLDSLMIPIDEDCFGFGEFWDVI